MNYDTAIKATATSVDSFNSAQREQDIFNTSLQARINNLTNAWYAFSDAAGQSIIYDSIVVVTEALAGVTNGGDSLVSTIGLLAPAFGVVGIAAYALSGALRTYVATTYATVAGNIAATGSTGALSGAMTLLGTASALATGALRGLAIASGIGILFAGVGFAIEKVVSGISEYIQAQEELDLYNERNTKALSDNKVATEELITSYKALSEARNNDPSFDSAKEQEYLQVQNSLAEIFPALVDHIDSTGQAHLRTGELIDKEVESVRELVLAQNDLTLAQAISEFERLKSVTEGGFDLSNFFTGNLEGQIEQTKRLIETAADNPEVEAKLRIQLINLQTQYQQANEEIKGQVFEIVTATNSINDIEIDSELSSEIKDFVASLDISNLDSSELDAFAKDLARIQQELQNALDTGSVKDFEKAIDDLNTIASGSSNFDLNLNGFTVSYQDLVDAIANGENTVIGAGDDLEGLGDSADIAGAGVDSLASKLVDYQNVVEQVAGVTQKGVEALDDLLFQYDALTAQIGNYTEAELQKIYTSQTLTKEEQRVKDALVNRLAVTNQITSAYPTLLGQDKDAIGLSKEKREAILNENAANKILLEGYKLQRDGKLTAEQESTLATATNTRARILEIQKEIQALIILQEQIKNTALTNAEFLAGINDGSQQSIGSSFYVPGQIDRKITANTVELQKLDNLLSSSTANIQSFSSAINTSSSSTKNSTSATKDNTSATKDNVKVTEERIKVESALEKITGKYALTQLKLNNALKNSQDQKGKYANFSKSYRKALQDEISLIQKQIDLSKAQNAELAKVPKQVYEETLVTTTTTPGTAGTSSANTTLVANGTVKPKGYSGPITSGYLAPRADGPHRGIDIDGAIGDRLDASVSGRVLKAGSAAKIGEHYSYGNLVIIQDEKNNKHYFAHLDDISVVAGQQLTAGTQIGTIGNTGSTSKGQGGDGSHLHYEIRGAKGGTIDPTSYINAARKGVTNYTATTTASVPSPTTSKGIATNLSNEEIVRNYFKNKGFSDNAVAGILGNVQQESGFDPKAENKKSGAYGIFQYLGSRKKDLQAYAKSVGKDISDIQVQLDFAYKELNSTEKKALTALNQNTSAAQQAADFDRLFERSEGTTVGKRQNFANQFATKYNGKPVSSTGTASSTSTTNGTTVSTNIIRELVDNPDYQKALQDIEKNTADNVERANRIAELNYEIIKSQADSFVYDRDLETNAIAKQEAIQERLLVHSKAYEQSLNKQYSAEQNKLNSLQKEDAFLQKSIKSGALNEAQIIELTERRAELSQEQLETENRLKDIYSDVINSNLARFDVQQNDFANTLAYEAAKIDSVDKSSIRYTKTLEKVNNTRVKQLDAAQKELDYSNNILKKGGLSIEVYEEITQRVQDLRIEILETNQAIQEGINSYLDLYNVRRTVSDNSINYETAKLQEVDTNSERYVLTLRKISKELIKKRSVNNDELDFLDKQIKSGQYSGVVLENLRQRYSDLTTEAKNLSVELRSLNNDIILNINTRVDERIDDKDFSIQRSKIIQSLYEQGSADYIRESEYQIGILRELYNLEKDRIRELQESRENVDLLPVDIKNLNEQLEEATLATLNYEAEIINSQKTLADELKDRNSKLADDLINSYKDYLGERRDATLKGIDEELKAETKRHDAVIKNINDERDAFNDAIDERLRAIDRAEAERGFNEDIDELELSRNDIQSQISLLSLDDSRESRSKRKALQKQLDDVDKQITDTQRNRQLELQRQGLNDLRETNDAQVEEKIETEDAKYEAETKRLDDLREYQEQYFNDQLNDERKFAEIREAIVAGNFDAIREEFGGFLTYLEDTLPDLENNLNGTLDAVGTAIRQNIIDNLREALDLLGKVQSTNNNLSNEFGSSSKYDENGINFVNPDPTENRNGVASLTDADLKVLLGKYINDVVSKEGNTDARVANIKAKGKALAAEGRAEGSTISSNARIEEVLQDYGEADLKKLGQYASTNFGGLETEAYINQIKEFAKVLRNGGLPFSFDGYSAPVRNPVVSPLVIDPSKYDPNKPDSERFPGINTVLPGSDYLSPILTAFASNAIINNNATPAVNDINLNFNIAELNGTQQEANNFANLIVNELRVTKGLRL